jgi:hypothetical protein
MVQNSCTQDQAMAVHVFPKIRPRW